MPPKPSLKAVLRALDAANEFAPVDNHPDEEVLVDYLDGLLDDETADQVSEHLSRCRECADTALYIAKPLVPMTAVAGPEGADLVARSGGTNYRRMLSMSLGAAALLLLGLFIGRFFPFTEHAVGARSIDLFAVDAVSLREPEMVRRIAVDDQVNYLVLNLNVTPATGLTQFEAKLVFAEDPEGELVFKQSIIYDQEGGFFSLIVPSTMLLNTRYQLSISGKASSESASVAVADFAFLVTRKP